MRAGAYYRGFDERAKETKRKILDFLICAAREGKQVVGYGAPGKGNTLLNYCGIRSDFLVYTDDYDTVDKAGVDALRNRAFVIKVNRLLRF